MQGTTTQKLAF